MSHATSIFTTSLFVFTLYKLRSRDSASAWFLIGIVGGLAAIVRWQDALFLVVPIFDRNKSAWNWFALLPLSWCFLRNCGLVGYWTVKWIHIQLEFARETFLGGKYFSAVLFLLIRSVSLDTSNRFMHVSVFFLSDQNRKKFLAISIGISITVYFIICAGHLARRIWIRGFVT